MDAKLLLMKRHFWDAVALLRISYAYRFFMLRAAEIRRSALRPKQHPPFYF